MNSKRHELGYKSLTQCVTDYLKERLAKGELKPGEEINLTSVCETLGVSRSPVREAMIQLIKEGFIEAAERRRFRIKKLTPHEIRDLYECGGLLESEIVMTACDKITEDGLDALEGLLKAVEAALDAGDPAAFGEANSAFNNRIWSQCDNRSLLELFDHVRERLYFATKRVDAEDWNRMLLDDHREILRLLRMRDKAGLESALREKHWSYSRNLPFVRRFYKFENDPESRE
jgi:DNA-binding GntR family transcriptional regulator